MTHPFYGQLLNNLDTQVGRAQGRCSIFLGNYRRSATYCRRPIGHAGRCRRAA